MKKYLLPILLIAFWSCEDKEEIKWDFDPLIGGTEIVTEGIWWGITNINDSQANWCDEDPNGDENEISYMIDDCRWRLPLDANISYIFNFKKGGAFNYRVAEILRDTSYYAPNGYYYRSNTDSLFGEWKTSNGTINVDISNHPSPTDILNYFFKDKDYQYETDINNGTLLLFNDKTEILLSVWNDGP